MRERNTVVGLDAHKKDIVVAMLLPGATEAETWTLANEPRAVRRLAKKLKREAPGAIRSAYEAGPCGYVLKRQIEAEGVPCEVVAPSLIPSAPGDRIKTDRRDARKLAEMLRAGLLTAVHPPSEEDEAVRDLCRCREDVKQDLSRCRQRLGKFLLRRGSGRPCIRRRWKRATENRSIHHGFFAMTTSLQRIGQDREAQPCGRLAALAGLDLPVHPPAELGRRGSPDRQASRLEDVRAQGRRMSAGTNRRTRARAMRQGDLSRTRDPRQRSLLTKHRHAALRLDRSRSRPSVRRGSSPGRTPPASAHRGAC